MKICSARFKLASSIVASALTVVVYLLHAHPGILKAILEWAALLFLAFSLMFSAVTAIWHTVNDNSAAMPNATGTLPEEVGFRLISKWGLRW